MRHNVTNTIAAFVALAVLGFCIAGCNSTQPAHAAHDGASARPPRATEDARTMATPRLAAAAAVADAEPSSTDAGLLLVAHGSPLAKWNQPLLDLEAQVQQRFQPNCPFRAIKLVFMEFTEPTIADGVHALEAAGCDRIVVVPLLIAPSSHSQRDVPSLLGLYADERVEATLRAEGATPVRSRLPITVTPTLDYGDLLEEVLLRRVQELSRDPQSEALVVLAHGDGDFEPIWSRRMRKLVTYLCGKTGITYGDYAFVHVGQAYALHGVPVIAAATEHRPRVLVVGCYLAMGATTMHQRYERAPTSRDIPMPNFLAGKDVVTSPAGLLPDPLVVEWIIRTAKQAL